MRPDFRIPETTLHQDLGGEAILLDLRTGVYYSLDDLGSKIWGVLARGESLSRMEEEILSEYDVPEERLRHDVKEFLDDLAGKGLLERVSDDGPERPAAAPA